MLDRTSDPPCFSSFPHSDQDPGLFLCRPKSRIVARRHNLRLPLAGQFRVSAQGRNRREGHGDGAGVTQFVLGRHHQQRGARDVGPCARLGPGKAVDLVLDGRPHQVVPGRVENNFVPAIAETVVGVKHRLVLIGFKPPALGLLGSEKLSEFAQLPIRPSRFFSLDRFHQVGVGEIQVISHQGWGLIEDFRCLRSEGNVE